MKRYLYLGSVAILYVLLVIRVNHAAVKTSSDLIYPRLWDNNTARSLSLGGCGITANEGAASVFFNPAALLKNQSESRFTFSSFLMNRFPSQTVLKQSNEIVLASNLGYKLNSRFSLMLGGGYIGSAMNVPQVDIDRYNSPVRNNVVGYYNERLIVVAGAINYETKSEQVFSLGLGQNLVSNQAGEAQGTANRTTATIDGGAIDLGLRWIYSKHRPDHIMFGSVEIVYRRFLDRTGKSKDIPQDHMLTMGWHWGFNDAKYWYPQWYSQFTFKVDDALAIGYKRAGVGLQISPLAIYTEQFNGVLLTIRGGLQTERWEISDLLGGYESGAQQSIRSGLGLTLPYYNMLLDIDAGVVLFGWGSVGGYNFQQEIHGKQMLLSITFTKIK